MVATAARFAGALRRTCPILRRTNRSAAFSTLKNPSDAARRPPAAIWAAAAVGVAAVGSIAFYAASKPSVPAEPAKRSVENKNAPRKISASGLPLFTRGEVAAHATPDTGIWVTHGSGVYDISEFVAIHPGGERIMLAAGLPVEPFWAVFSIHGTPETRELLETYRIGDLVPRDEDPTAAEAEAAAAGRGIAALFANEPERHSSLIVRAERPCNAEAAVESLEPFVTPNERFFVRNHLPVPLVDPENFRLVVEGPGVPDGFAVSLQDLMTCFPHTSVMATLQCAGNRRREMHEIRPVKGLQWSQGAISNAVWTGVRLRDVLAAAGYTPPDPTSVPADGRAADSDAVQPADGVLHVHFDGADGYGASIPVDKALDPRGDVVLAFAMNGEPIPRDHGFPLRTVVPGHVAARSVKWVSHIALSDDESPSHWQRRDYKGFSPSATLETSDYSKSVSIQELPVQSAIISPLPGDVVKPDSDGNIVVKGYAVSGGGRGIIRVDVSSDGGSTWTDAQVLRKPMQPSGREWAWTQWEAKLPVTNNSKQQPHNHDDPKQVEIVCKAIDTSYNTQPEKFESVYNVRGVLVSAWHRIRVNLDANKDAASQST